MVSETAEMAKNALVTVATTIAVHHNPSWKEFHVHAKPRFWLEWLKNDAKNPSNDYIFLVSTCHF